MIDFFGIKANRQLLILKAFIVTQDNKIDELRIANRNLEQQIKVLESLLDKNNYSTIDYPNSRRKGGVI